MLRTGIAKFGRKSRKMDFWENKVKKMTLLHFYLYKLNSVFLLKVHL